LNENKQIALLIIVVTIIGLAGFYLAGDMHGIVKTCGLGSCRDVYVDNYRAELFLNGTLKENFVYEIKESGKYRMLYRSWKAPLLQKDEEHDVPYIEMVSITPPPGTYPYIKDFKGDVKVLSPSSSYTYEIASLAVRNEAGCYSPQRFRAGVYEISYISTFHPPLESDEELYHLNLKLAEEHLPYKHVTIIIHDPEGMISQLFIHPAMDTSKEGETWVIEGASPENTLLEIEMLLEGSPIIDGFLRNVSDVRGKTLEANSKYSNTFNFYSLLVKAIMAMLFLYPVGLILVYNKYGKERSTTVPRFLSFVPKKRKPWIVNLVFRKSPFDFDENGFYATLLDLHRREIIQIETIKNGVKLKLIRKPDASDDDYERNVMRFIEQFGVKDVFNTHDFEQRIETLREKATSSSSTAQSTLKDIRDRMRILLKVADKELAEEFAKGGRKYAVIMTSSALVLVITMLLLFPEKKMYPQLIAGLYFSCVIFIQSLPPVLAPSVLFGRWKENYYKEKLEWDAFRTFLKDFVAIQKYAPEDLKIWQEWLVYATALGIGREVAKAMEKLNIYIPEVDIISDMPYYFQHSYSRASELIIQPGESEGFGFSGGGGGFGSGGGFGGGGGVGGGGGGAR
jgi:uncharacterized membrane protein